MSLLLAAIGATVTALAEASFAPYLTIGATNPHLVLVGGVIWTIAAGTDRGITWAFVGGLVLDALLGRPLGASSFALLVAVGGASLVAHPLSRVRVLAPLIAVPPLSLCFSLLLYLATAAVQPGVTTPDPVALFLPSVVFDSVLALLFGPLAVSVHDRRVMAGRLDRWPAGPA